MTRVYRVDLGKLELYFFLVYVCVCGRVGLGAATLLLTLTRCNPFYCKSTVSLLCSFVQTARVHFCWKAQRERQGESPYYGWARIPVKAIRSIITRDVAWDSFLQQSQALEAFEGQVDVRDVSDLLRCVRLCVCGRAQALHVFEYVC